MRALALGTLATSLGAPAPLSALADEIDEDGLAGMAEDFDHVLVADSEIWQSAAAAASKALKQGDEQSPDLLLYVSQNDRDTTASTARLAVALGLSDVPRLALSGHECANLGPALQVASDALAAGRARRVLLVLADHARSGARMMRSGMSFFSDGAAAVLVASAEDATFAPLCRVEDVAVVPIPGTSSERPNLRATAAAVRAAVDALSAAADPDLLVLAHYRTGSRSFLQAATGLREAEMHQPSHQRYGHVFGIDQLMGLADLADFSGSAVVLAIGPWSSAALLVDIPGR